jgi:hypothetical protein
MRSFGVGAAAIVVALAVAAAIACASFSSPDDSATTDADTDARPSDDSGIGPGPADADAAGPPFCASIDASFCWSFDEAPYLFGPLLQRYGASPDVTDANPHSPPNAMIIVDGGNKSAVELSATGGKHIHCDLQIYIDALGSGGADVLYLQESPQVHTYSLHVDPQAGSARVQLSLDGANKDIGNIATGKWTRLSLDLALGLQVAATGAVDALTATLTSVASEAGIAAFGSFVVDFGIRFASDGWMLRFDDLVCSY